MPQINLQVNKAFLPYLNDDRKFQIYYGGAGSGKSAFVCQKLTMMLLKEKRKLLVVRQTYASHRESTFAEFKTTFERMGISEIVKVRESNLGITFPNGSEIVFKGCDDESKLLSISGISDCFIEEATEISYEIFSQLILRIRNANVSNHFFIAFNPVSELHWIKSQVIENEYYVGKENGFAMHSTYKDNAFLPESYIEGIERMKIDNPAKYRVYGLGLWGLMGKLVYNNWTVEKINVEKLMRKYPKIRSVFGLDFGFSNDPTAFVHALVDEETKQMWIVNELYKTEMLNKDIAKWIMENDYQFAPIVADSAEQKSIADLRNMGIQKIRPARKGKGSINAGIDLISSYKIYIDERCVNAILEFGSYAYVKDRKTNKYTNKPIDKFNHLLDALRYAMEEFLGKHKKARSLSKSVLGL